MGMAEVIPGVSGGTIAFITGIYEKLINTIKAFGPEAIQGFQEGGIAGGWKAINGNFLVALLSGMAIGIIAGVFGISYLLETYPEMLWGFFFGLIVASAIYIAKQVTNWSIPEIALLVGGAALAYWITIASPAEGNTALWFVFISGAIAISALILPGISGSFILLLMGMYTFIVPTVKDALSTLAPEALLIMAVFAAGCALGLVVFSRVLSWTFKHYPNPTLALLTGFMIGSLNKIWPWRIPTLWVNEEGTFLETTPGLSAEQIDELKLLQETNVLPGNYPTDPYLIGVIILMILGFTIVFLLERLDQNKA